jgi:hypothetical protein
MKEIQEEETNNNDTKNSALDEAQLLAIYAKHLRMMKARSAAQKRYYCKNKDAISEKVKHKNDSMNDEQKQLKKEKTKTAYAQWYEQNKESVKEKRRERYRRDKEVAKKEVVKKEVVLNGI